MVLVVSSRAEFSSMDEFITGALAFLEADPEFSADWFETYKNRTVLPAGDEAVAFVRERIKAMDERVGILLQPVIKAVNVIPPRWNNVTLGLETEHDYIFWSWSTSA